MARETGISWTDATHNPWWGCERVSPECARCYADTFAKRYGFDVWGDGTTARRFFSDDHWRKPVSWNAEAEKRGKPLKVFCASMADVFEDRLDVIPHRERLWRLIEETPWLRWQLLTKRPENIMRMIPEDWRGELPRNVWAGTSIGNHRYAYRAAILREVPAAVRFLSCEPLLGDLFADLPKLPWRDTPDGAVDAYYMTCKAGCKVRVHPYGLDLCPHCGSDLVDIAPLDLEGIHWVIVGGESGSRQARPMAPDWVRALRDECEIYSIPFHFKQWGSWAPATIENSDRKVRVVMPGGEMVYMGPAPTSGGKMLDGRDDWCQLPDEEGVLV